MMPYKNPAKAARYLVAWRRRNQTKTKAQWSRASAKKQDTKYSTAARPCPEFCECCGREGKLQFDHDHVTGQFRGWLCNQCNSGIGFLGDDLSGALHAVKYLR